MEPTPAWRNGRYELFLATSSESRFQHRFALAPRLYYPKSAPQCCKAVATARVGVRTERAVGAKREQPRGHGAPARLPCTCKGARAALLAVFDAARARVLPAQRRAVARAPARL
jgi:hypothetical protein